MDDVSYFDEPFFSDGPIADAVDDVTADGVSYFSSAGNSGDKGAWQSKIRLIPAAQGLPSTNLDFADVDPALYDGGLQDMNPGAGTDVAQTLKLDETGGIITLQWDNPFDIDGATFGDPIFTGGGEITTADPEPVVNFTPTAGQVGQIVGVPRGRHPVRLHRPGADRGRPGRQRDRAGRHQLLAGDACHHAGRRHLLGDRVGLRRRHR